MLESSSNITGIKAVVEISDEGSGLNYNECRYIFTESSDLLGRNISLYTDGGLNSNVNTFEVAKPAGTYYLHVLVTDKYGNVAEVVSGDSVTVN